MDKLPVIEPTEEEWEWGGRIALAEIRAETGIPNWKPRLLNGSYEFGRRVRAMVRKKRENEV